MPTPDDISYDALRSARILDRLPPGKHIIILDKTAKDSEIGWDISIHKIGIGEQFYLKRKTRKQDNTT